MYLGNMSRYKIEIQNINPVIKNYSMLLKSLGIRPNLKLGQVFLINERIVDEQINFADITKKDTVLEIGPGLGVLTTKLSKLAQKVIAIEYDKKLFSYLKDILAENVELIYGDALKVDFPKFNKFVSNIPYQISSPLIFKLIEHKFEHAIIMLQMEFVQRLIASTNTKDYSRLTVMSSYYFDINLLKKVSKNNFLPIPEVGSAIVKLIPKRDRKIANNEQFFFNFVKIVFSERRKMMKNSLINQFPKLFGRRPDLKAKDVINQLPFKNHRPEQLSLEQLIDLSDELHAALID